MPGSARPTSTTATTVEMSRKRGKKANVQAGITPQSLLALISLFDDDVQQEILMWFLEEK